MAADGARLLVPPGAPLVYEQAYLAFRVFLVHDGLVLLDNLLYLKAFAQRPVVLVVVELGGRALRSVPA